MPRPVPYVFCRYQMTVDEAVLDKWGQASALESIKGQLFAHGSKAMRDGIYDILVMRPKKRTVSGEDIITWSVGHKPGMRRKTEYHVA